MANTPFILQSNFNSTHLLQQTFNFPRLVSIPLKFLDARANRKLLKHSPKLRLKCFIMNPKITSQNPLDGNRGEDLFKTIASASGVEIWRSIRNFVKALQKPVITGVLLGLLLMYDRHQIALAASGGRMGGRSFSSSSSSSSSSSRSYSTRTSGSGLSSSSSYISYSTGTSDPEVSFTAPYFAPSPVEGFVVGSSFVFVMAGFVAFVLVFGFLSDRSDGSVLTATDKTSVLKLQVGLLGSGRTLQRDLNRIAEAADTSTPEGLSFVLQETILALLRHPDYCISGYSSVDVKRSIEEGEKRFNKLSIEERGKFDEETLVNVNNIKKQSGTSQRSNGFRNEYIITIIVAAGGVHKLPPINSSAQLKEALQKLASIPSSRIMAVEVLWTPQNENDTLTEQELLEDYSLLRPL